MEAVPTCNVPHLHRRGGREEARNNLKYSATKLAKSSALTFTVESAFPDTSMFFFSSIPLVRDWWPERPHTITSNHTTVNE